MKWGQLQPNVGGYLIIELAFQLRENWCDEKKYQYQLQLTYQMVALAVETTWVVDHLTTILDEIEICVTMQTF